MPGLAAYRERSGSSCLIGISDRLKGSFTYEQQRFSPTNPRTLSSSPLAAKYSPNSGALNKRHLHENASASPIDITTSSTEINVETNQKRSIESSPSSRPNIKASPRNSNCEIFNESNDCIFVGNTTTTTNASTLGINVTFVNNISNQNVEIKDNGILTVAENKVKKADEAVNIETDFQVTENITVISTGSAPHSTLSADEDGDMSSPGSKRLRIASFSSGDESEPN